MLRRFLVCIFIFWAAVSWSQVDESTELLPNVPEASDIEGVGNPDATDQVSSQLLEQKFCSGNDNNTFTKSSPAEFGNGQLGENFASSRNHHHWFQHFFIFPPWISALASFVAAITGVLAVYLLKGANSRADKMISEAKETLRVTKEYGQAQSRSYPSITNFEIRSATSTNALEYGLHIRNSGVSPLRNPSLFVVISVSSKNKDAPNIDQYFKRDLSDLPASSTVRIGSYNAPWIRFSKDSSGVQMGEICYVGLTAIIFGTDVFGNEIWHASRWHRDDVEFHRLRNYELHQEFGVPECLSNEAVKSIRAEIETLGKYGAPLDWPEDSPPQRAGWTIQNS